MVGLEHNLWLSRMPICRDSPSTIYEIGSVIEDCNAIMKITKFNAGHSGHSYQVDVLQWKVEPPDNIRPLLDMKNFWILVTAQSFPKIKLHQ